MTHNFILEYVELNNSRMQSENQGQEHATDTKKIESTKHDCWDAKVHKTDAQ